VEDNAHLNLFLQGIFHGARTRDQSAREAARQRLIVEGLDSQRFFEEVPLYKPCFLS
jgi:hypothetical protein